MSSAASVLADPAAAACDLLARAAWSCLATPAGACSTPAELPRSAERFAAQVPGTAAGALRDAGVHGWRERDYDAEDWWFLGRFDSSGHARGRLVIGGVATLGELWCNGRLVWTCESMFVPGEVLVAGLGDDNELALCCRALAPRLARRAGRARWRNTLVERQSLRTLRTTLLGRIPGWAPDAAPVGPWRALRLEPLDAHGAGPTRIVVRRLAAAARGAVGVVELEADVLGSGVDRLGGAELRAGGASTELRAPTSAPLPGAVRVRGRLEIPSVEAWWPHTHGLPRRYDVTVAIGTGAIGTGAIGTGAIGTGAIGTGAGAGAVGVEELAVGRVGFRTVETDRRDGGFALVVNGEPIFARGVCWVSPDPVTLAAPAEAVRGALEQLRDAGCNLIRLTGTATYEDGAFFEACDELGLLVWQDCMLANWDPPEDDAFVALLRSELDAALGPLAGRACLALVSGGSEIEQQAAMSGVAPGWGSSVLDEVIPAAVRELLPGVPFLRSSPTGGEMPFSCDRGVAHYFGVGAYLRNLDDARRASVRFAAECLAFSTPPEPASLEAAGTDLRGVGHHPAWKRGVPRDGGASWDFEDVRDHYVEELFGEDARALRYRDPARWLDLGRAAVAECFSALWSEWRRPGSGCAGGIVLSGRDLWPGAGWGVVDAGGRPKAPWYVMRRLLAPVALLLTDEGLNGLRVHLVNDTPLPVAGTIELTAYRDGAEAVERGSAPVEIGGRSARSLDAAGLLKGFRDLTYAYRFGPAGHDVVHVAWRGAGGEAIAEECYLPLGPSRPLEADLGLAAVAVKQGEGWALECRTERFAQWVALDLPGWQPSDSWFHLAPGARRLVLLRAEPQSSPGRPPQGEVRALNARWPVRTLA